MRTVLLVEDQAQVRKVIRRMLERTGCRVISASDGAEALEVEDEFEDRIDILLTDIVLPGMDGVEIARQMNLRRVGIRTLFMSGYPDDVVTKHVGSIDNSSILTKPFEWRQLAERVQSLFDEADVAYG